jgi:hypothetical protein
VFSLGVSKGLFVSFLDTSSVLSGFIINIQIYVNAVLTRSTNLACVGKEWKDLEEYESLIQHYDSVLPGQMR